MSIREINRPKEHPQVVETEWGVMTLDPQGAYVGVNRTKLVDAMGIIPYFVATIALTPDIDTAQKGMDGMNEVYGFGLGDYNMLDAEEASIDSVGQYTYTGDPDLFPIAEFKLNTGLTVWVYQYALVAVTDGENTIMQRMD